jgi:hypothetical protein
LSQKRLAANRLRVWRILPGEDFFPCKLNGMIRVRNDVAFDFSTSEGGPQTLIVRAADPISQIFERRRPTDTGSSAR